MTESGPSQSTIKRLFALSGNRCAFPKCEATMALEDTLVGEVCHIKGLKRGAARHDPDQTAAQRNDYANLILLCAPHHKVVDDDEEAYTVERLQKMKADHEARATPLSDNDAGKVATAYSAIVSINQSGGIAAQNFTATNVTLQAAQEGDRISKRQLEALENLWGIIRAMRKDYSLVIYVDMILVANEIDDYFRNGRYRQVMDVVRDYADPQYVAKMIASIDPDKERPFVSARIWSILFALRALYGRTALLMQNSFLDRRYNDWRSDSGTEKILRGLIPGSIVDDIRQRQIGGLSAATDYLEALFLNEAGLHK
jgi:hypothetical protein